MVKINARQKDLPKALKKDYNKFKRLAEARSKENGTSYYVVLYKTVNGTSVLNTWDETDITYGMKYNVIKVLYNGKE